MMIVFSLTEATGVAIGLGISGADPIVGNIILSIAGGTFIYIACSEIIVEEFSKDKFKILKLAVFILGAVIICLLWFTDRG